VASLSFHRQVRAGRSVVEVGVILHYPGGGVTMRPSDLDTFASLTGDLTVTSRVRPPR
jgi:hypothetical protein